MGNMMRASLFGGALGCAGLFAGGAGGQDIQFSYTSVTAQGYDDDYEYYIYDFAGPDQAWRVDAFRAEAMGNPESITFSANTGNWLFAYAAGYSYFSVSQNVLGEISWEVHNDLNRPNNSYLRIENMTLGTMIFSIDIFDPPGEASIALNSDHTYRLSSQVYGCRDIDNEYFTRLTVPSPPSAATLALAGLAASRRRR